MTLNLSNLKPAKGSTKKKKRIGRGGKRGAYSGKGMKGQKARSGVSGLKALGFRQTLLRTPKSRGFRSIKSKMPVVDIVRLEKKVEEGAIIDIRKMKRLSLVESNVKSVKVIGKGELTKKITVIANAFSAGAKDAILKAGGKVEIIEKKAIEKRAVKTPKPIKS
ncbi:MAG: 50S ribosomal protein L15 [Patescibacteria group bacterium]|jgi:large subunit ribosomal protein L15